MVVHDPIATFENQQGQFLHIFQINTERFGGHSFVQNSTLPDYFLIGNQPEFHVSAIIVPVVGSN